MQRIFALAMPLVLWGVWAFLPKLAIKRLGNETTVFAFQSMGSLLGALIVFFWMHDSKANAGKSIDGLGALFALGTGIIGAGALFFYLRAISRDSVAVVSSITALYPIVAALLARGFLAETLTWRQIAGMALALAAVVLVGDSH